MITHSSGIGHVSSCVITTDSHSAVAAVLKCVLSALRYPQPSCSQAWLYMQAEEKVQHLKQVAAVYFDEIMPQLKGQLDSAALASSTVQNAVTTVNQLLASHHTPSEHVQVSAGQQQHDPSDQKPLLEHAQDGDQFPPLLCTSHTHPFDLTFSPPCSTWQPAVPYVGEL